MPLFQPVFYLQVISTSVDLETHLVYSLSQVTGWHKDQSLNTKRVGKFRIWPVELASLNAAANYTLLCRPSSFEEAQTCFGFLQTPHWTSAPQWALTRGQRTGASACRPASLSWLFCNSCVIMSKSHWELQMPPQWKEGASLLHDVLVKMAPVKILQKLFKHKIICVTHIYLTDVCDITHPHHQGLMCILSRCQGRYKDKVEHSRQEESTKPPQRRWAWEEMLGFHGDGKGQSSPSKGKGRERDTQVGYRVGPGEPC